MAEKKDNSMAMIAIVAVVAIVGIVMMFMNNNNASEYYTSEYDVNEVGLAGNRPADCMNKCRYVEKKSLDYCLKLCSNSIGSGRATDNKAENEPEITTKAGVGIKKINECSDCLFGASCEQCMKSGICEKC